MHRITDLRRKLNRQLRALSGARPVLAIFRKGRPLGVFPNDRAAGVEALYRAIDDGTITKVKERACGCGKWLYAHKSTSLYYSMECKTRARSARPDYVEYQRDYQRAYQLFRYYEDKYGRRHPKTEELRVALDKVKARHARRRMN